MRLLLCLLAALRLSAFDQTPFEHERSRTVLQLDPGADNPRNSEGSFVTLKDGRVLFIYTAYYGKSGADDGAARLMAVESNDAGLTWSKPRTAIENHGRKNVMSVSLLRLKSGRIGLFYLVKNGWTDCHVVMRTSSDEAATWSEPTRIGQAPGYFVLNNDRIIQTAKGRLVVPLAFHRSRGSDPDSGRSFDARAITQWLVSDDEGATWAESSSWWAMPVRSSSGLQEPGVVELADGSLFSWARTDAGFQYGFRSTDAGRTWSPPEPTTLASPVSPASIRRIPGSSDLLCLHNDHSGQFPFKKGFRTPLVASLSKDDGRTWTGHRLLEGDPDGWYCYTAIHYVGDSVLLAYCAGDSTKRSHLNHLRIRRVSLSWLTGR